MQILSKLLIRISASTKVSRKVSIWGRIWALRWSSSSDGTTCRSNHQIKRNKQQPKTDEGKCMKNIFTNLTSYSVEVIELIDASNSWSLAYLSSIGLILFSISSSSFRHCSSKAILAFSASISLISEWKVFVLVSKYSRSRFLSFFSKGQKDTKGPSNKHGYQKDASGYLSQTIHNQVFLRLISVRAFSLRRSVSFFCHFWQWSTKAFLSGWKSVSMKSITTSEAWLLQVLWCRPAGCGNSIEFSTASLSVNEKTMWASHIIRLTTFLRIQPLSLSRGSTTQTKAFKTHVYKSAIPKHLGVFLHNIGLHIFITLDVLAHNRQRSLCLPECSNAAEPKQLSIKQQN